MSSLETLVSGTHEALELARDFAFNIRAPDGHWCAEVYSNVTFTAEYIFLKQALGIYIDDVQRDALIRWLVSKQSSDGSWGLIPDGPGNISTTVEAYLALKILGLQSNQPPQRKARDWIKKAGGIEKVRMFTRIFLASFGLLSWNSVPQLPVELILLPALSPINIYSLSSWARATTIPLLLVRYHEPIYALSNGKSTENDFLDELWCNPSFKNIPYSESLYGLWNGGDLFKFLFTAVDKAISLMGRFLGSPVGKYARQRCVDWLLDHQEESGDWAGYWPPMHGSVWGLYLEGFDLNHPVIVKALEAMERFVYNDKDGMRVQATVSPVWDTVLMTVALCDSGTLKENKPLLKPTIEWIKSHQLSCEKGDWRVYNPTLAPGGWSFEYFNTWYPDVDDTAVAIMALLKDSPESIGSSSIVRGVEWILGMQNADGGWGSFDFRNDKLFLNKLPFSDMNSLCDPSTVDVTGRIMECFGMLLFSPHNSDLAVGLLARLNTSTSTGISYLIANQEEMGAWWGRWGVNYVYGTSNVLCGLASFYREDKNLSSPIFRAVEWLKSVQNPDGGWGESVASYTDPKQVGCGESTAPQTAWGLMALLAYLPPLDESIRKGIHYLISSQSLKGEVGASWPVLKYTGTGFPDHLYLEYSLYPHYFPVMALGRYIRKVETGQWSLLKENEKVSI